MCCVTVCGVAVTDSPGQQSLSPEVEVIVLQKGTCLSAGESSVPSTSPAEGPVSPGRYSLSAGEKTSVLGTLSIPRSFVLMPFPTAVL